MVRLKFAGLAVLVALAATVMAQDKKDDPKKDSPKDDPVLVRPAALPKYYKQLGLSDQQKMDILKVRAAYTAKLADLKKQERDLLAKEKEEQEKLLTDAQRARLKELILGEPAPKKDDKAPVKDK
jgi:Spy/CpxP family protein refolding chaperone